MTINGKRAISQAAIGRALDLAPPTVSKLKKQGMPTHSVEAARAWRDVNVGLRINPNSGKYRPTPRDQAHQATELVRLANELGGVAAVELAAGNFGRVEALRAALRRVPAQHRGRVSLSIELWEVLTRHVFEKFEAEAPAPTEMSDDEADEVGAFWYAAACGELVLA